MASILGDWQGQQYPALKQDWDRSAELNLRKLEPWERPAYERRIPRPRRVSDEDDIYEGAAETFDWHREGVTDELQVLPTEFAKEILAYRGVNGVTPDKDRDTINAWNRFKKEQYLRRGQGGWQVPKLYQGRNKPGEPFSQPVYSWMTVKTDLVDPEKMLSEAEAMERQGSAEGFPLTSGGACRGGFCPLTSSDASVVPKPNIPQGFSKSQRSQMGYKR
jgi:hypothetical protein|tara:strand:- start:4648 stop:5304 length:657 start_codon:yes stop_codon:yes gene_type:complete